MALPSIIGGLLTSTWTVTKQYTYEPVVAEASFIPEVATTTKDTEPVKEECSCVSFVRSKIPSFPRGDAVSLLPNSIYPVKGGAIKLSYQDGNNFNVYKYHVAYVEKVTAEGIYISEKCFPYGNEDVNYRVIPFNSDRIRGYWRPLDNP